MRCKFPQDNIHLGRHSKGASLLEVLLTVALLAVTVFFAVPWYGDYARKASIAEGMNLATIGKRKVEELVTIGEIGSPGSSGAIVWPPLPPGFQNTGPIEIFEAPWEILENKPSSSVDSIIRGGSVVIVTYSKKLDPASQSSYSLVLAGEFKNHDPQSIIWHCHIDTAAIDDINNAKLWNMPVGEPLPLRLAPSECRN